MHSRNLFLKEAIYQDFSNHVLINAMMTGEGPFGPIEMGGMFTVVKIRDGKVKEKEKGWYNNPPGTVAKRIKHT